MEIEVKKRSGALEKFDAQKINKILEWAIQGIEDVNSHEIAMNAQMQFVDGITTKQIHESLIDSAANLISEENPNYQYVASRLLSYQLRKEVWGGKTPPKLYDLIKQNIELKYYSDKLLKKYSESEINKFGEYVDHDRDFIFTYAGIKQMTDKYLVKNRNSGRIFETPQFAYMCIAMFAFQNYKKTKRKKYVKMAYDFYSKHKISLSSPFIAGMRTPLESYSSCCLIDVDDTMESIYASVSAVAMATSNRYGIGFNFGRIRGIGSPVKNGTVIHTGVIPFLKVFESTVKSCHQNAMRGGSATCTFPIWHYEIEDILQLKNNLGTDDNRVRKLDYSISISKLFYSRFVDKDSYITLFSPHEVQDLYDKFGTPEFDELYEKYENDPNIKVKKRVKSSELLSLLIKERTETGRIYPLNIDHANSHSAWDLRVVMSNLCQEILHPLIPMKSFDDPDAEIGVCVLSAVNVVNVSPDEMEDVCDVQVRMLDELIDLQTYFNRASENFAKKRRSLGIGVSNYAAYLAMNNTKYSDENAPIMAARLMESIQYNLLKASVNLAKEKGKCEKFEDTKYSKGILPIDTYKKAIDDFVPTDLIYDWESLREEIREHGLRNSTLSALMPVQSSSVIQNATNGIEPIRDFIEFESSKSSSIPKVVPNLKEYKDSYEKCYDMRSNEGYLKNAAAFHKFVDMAISTNTYYNYAHYPNRKLPDSIVFKDLLLAYKYGLATLYYSNTDDGNNHNIENKVSCGEGGCTL